MRWLWGIAAVIAAAATGTALTLGPPHNKLAASSRLTASAKTGHAVVPLLGASISTKAIVNKDTAEFGHMPIVRVYYPTLPPANAWTTGMAGFNKSAAIVSFKALPKTILSGAADATLRHFFATAPTGHPIYYCYYHEPEDNIAAGEFTLAGYKAAWAHIVALARAVHNPWLHSTIILMSYDLKPFSHRNWKSYIPGGGVIDVLGWDAYPVGASGPVHDPKLTPPTQFLGPAVAAAKSIHMPFGFAEFGQPKQSGRPGWLNQVGNYLMHSGALFGTLFNCHPPLPSMTLDDGPSIAVWHHFVRASVIANAGGGSNPPPPKKHKKQGLQINGLTLSKRALQVKGRQHTTMRFSLTSAATVSVLVLNAQGNVTHNKTLVQHGAGWGSMNYLGYAGSGHPEPAGHYKILIVASNSRTTVTAEVRLTITR